MLLVGYGEEGRDACPLIRPPALKSEIHRDEM